VSYPGPGHTVITMKSSAFQSKKARVKLPTGLSSRSSFAEMDLGAVVDISLGRLGEKRDVGGIQWTRPRLAGRVLVDVK
jgi:hypothetical protein